LPCVTLRLEDGTFLEFPNGGGVITRQTNDVFSDYLRVYVENHRNESLV